MGKPTEVQAMLLLCALAACEAKPPVIQESDVLVLRGPSDVEICAGTFSTMQAELVELFNHFDQQPQLIEYSWMPFTHYDQAEFPCTTPQAVGCALDSDIYARSLAVTHELVHASRGRLPTALEEGLASFLSPPRFNSPGAMTSRDAWLEALELGMWTEDALKHYERSAHFVSFLIAEWGWDTFLAFEKRLTNNEQEYYGLPLDSWREDFENSYSVSFAEAWELYADYPDCPLSQFHQPVSACLLASDPEATLSIPFGTPEIPYPQFTDTLECSDDRVVGPVSFNDSDDRRMRSFMIEIISPLDYEAKIKLIGEINAGSRALLTNCGDCWDGTGIMLTASEPKDWKLIPSGTYALTLYSAMDASGEIGVELQY